MKKCLSITLICIFLMLTLTGCGKKDAPASGDEGTFAPEATEAISAGLTQVLENEAAQDETKAVTLEELLADVDAEAEDEGEVTAADAEFGDEVAIDEPEVDQEIAEDVPLDTEDEEEPVPTAEPTPEPTPTEDAVMPFATATPQPNAIITSYSECTGTGLGFRFSYPSGWTNIPGRNTICYVQPLDNGTVYPARIAITMKKLAHRCTDELCRSELVDYLKLLRTQYDASTFEVDSNLNVDQKFMNKKAMSTTYLAYDGKQEIQGYVIMTYFERYIFAFHFLCAYEDYPAFQPAIAYMRDSVKADG